jgi:hypothetical protein
MRPGSDNTSARRSQIVRRLRMKVNSTGSCRVGQADSEVFTSAASGATESLRCAGIFHRMSNNFVRVSRWQRGEGNLSAES